MRFNELFALQQQNITILIIINFLGIEHFYFFIYFQHQVSLRTNLFSLASYITLKQCFNSKASLNTTSPTQNYFKLE